ncbi:MAG: hypothetical protein NT175_03830 [Bacteroidetes bacterium]|nr:hypothetical protein [Bacteroidota bacterium]
MILSIVIDYSGWFILLCLLTGALFSVILYLRNRKDELPVWMHNLLGVIRFISISLIAFLLLSPLLKSITRSYEKPVIIFAQDNSQSVIAGKDSTYYLHAYPEAIDILISDLKKDYDVSLYTFGDGVNAIEKGYAGLPGLFSEKQTDISEVFNDLQARYSNRNVGGIIIASDGVYNKGMNPVYGSQKNRFAVYTVALGDTTVQKDLILAKVNYNRMAYRGNKFPVEVLVRAYKCDGLTTKLDITKDGELLFTKNVALRGDNHTENILLELEAKASGLQRYRISLAPLKDEISLVNNYTDIFVDVLDDRQKILILAAAPHPDISAMKQAIESNYNYEVEDYLVDAFTQPLSKFNLVILHQLPSRQEPALRVLTELTASKIPVLYIIGTQSNIVAFNQLSTGLILEGVSDKYNEALPAINPGFVLFGISDETRRMYNDFPPLMTPFCEYKTTPSVNILFFQRIGKITTSMPMVLFNQGQDVKTGVITGEGLWKWRLMDYARNDQHLAFNEFILKTIQYLSVKEDRSFFRIFCKNRFLENETVEFDAEVYTKNYEPITDPEVEIIIRNDNDEKFPYVFRRTAGAYHLSTGSFPVGNYSYQAHVKVGNDLYERTGQFSVEALNIEKINTVANHNLLFNLVKNNGGKMFFPAQINDIRNTLKDRQDIKTVIYAQKRYNKLNNILWVLVLIAGLLSVEWFIRKIRGSY